MRLVIYFLVLLPWPLWSMGLGDWHEVTPQGTDFNDPGGMITMTLPNGTPYCAAKEWYFYKGYIMGIGLQLDGERLLLPRDTIYFILEEASSTIQEFEDQASWITAIEAQHLKPWIWTRWYRDSWNHWYVLLFWLLFLLPLSLLLGGATIYNIYRLTVHSNTRSSRGRWFGALALPVLLLLTYLLSAYPGSW